MIAATFRSQGSARANLLHVDATGGIAHAQRGDWIARLRRGDLVVANDAATLPASLAGIHVPSGKRIELRLAGRCSLATEDVRRFVAIVFGEGDFHLTTEERPPPPALAPGDRVAVGPLSATIEATLGHPRLVALRFDGTPSAIWEGLARHGRPIQYAHVPAPLALWDVWTPIAGPPVAFEPPSAGFALDWRSLDAMRSRGIAFATLTHAAGLSSSGDADLDRRLPFDEPYAIPASTARLVRRAQAAGRRVVAVGTTVVRALEHAAAREGGLRAGDGVATQRIGRGTRLRVVDAILTGTHQPGTSHFELLRAFADDETLRDAANELETHAYRTHEFGDSMLIERQSRPPATPRCAPAPQAPPRCSRPAPAHG
jgi:S-adenosylmethionine:tRNA ribosyltransferase-isomerase